ncbi:RnfABCDGE type electron transport complex subunit D [Peptostreptococcus canis]|uniref:Ion-translocating oxidoreductase complex subunit D n=1 Tax=Peptostreptococcus canis TaxID=1159213 RepID=A0ABR6TL11_9FIRM|nr:RnfABCDGE type electron transport complex subunit D [Peptostreptococcus canis]MBC2576091.1 RnfABCDGE type electron transport complex subunit D [Peptostreptococcus canis]MBP1997783.1 electron transport complex protein RnfD [Peptostreptococcus canis]
MNEKLIVSSSPHIRTKEDTSYIMKQVILALLPATAAGIYYFRVQGLITILACVIGCVGSEWLYCKITKRNSTIHDLSAVVTGLLLAFNVPAGLPIWMCLFGSIFSIIVVKMLFGGIGFNFLNPALAGRAFLLASFPVAMTTWLKPGANSDAVTTATPLSFLKLAGSNSTNAINSIHDAGITLGQMFMGNIGGTVGETCSLLLIIGGLYLIYKGIISYVMPATYIILVVVLSFIFGGFNAEFAMYEALAGGLLLGGFFMLTDYTTSPMTKKGQIIYAAIAAVIATCIRLFGGYPEGVSYSILFANCLVPLIDKYVNNRVFGEVRK